MGLVFYEDLGGETVYTCIKCGMYLTHQCYFMSDNFVGSSGPAELLRKVFNIAYRPPQKKQMISGMHHASDIHCKRCDSYLGWFYEYADREQQQYKEDSHILELRYISKQERADSKCFHPEKK